MTTQMTTCAISAFGILALANGAKAYTKEGHFEITNAAYQVLRAASASRPTAAEAVLKTPGACASGGGLCAGVVSQQQWDVFLRELDWTRRYVGGQPSSIPPTTGEQECTTSSAETDLARFSVAEIGTRLGRSSLASDHRHLNRNTCSIDEWYPVGLYSDIDQRVAADGSRQQGKVLGWHAKNRDDDIDETMIDVNPIVAGPLFEVGTEAYERLLGAVILPLVCAFEFISGDASACDSDARRIADKTNLVEVFTAMIPGFHLARSETYIGFWHLMNVRDDPTLMNAYNDDPGMYLPDAGPQKIPGTIDSALVIGSQLLNVRLVAESSRGAARYWIRESDDSDGGNPERTNFDWRREPFGTTEFSPLDNLALAGYARLHANDPVTRLGWPLHAIGDATVPMHVVATASWGHSSYEAWVEQNWANLTYQNFCDEGQLACARERQANQIAQAGRVLQLAYRWRDYLTRPQVPSDNGERPGIRDFITALASDTLKRVGDNLAAWPWCDLCSVGYDADGGKVLIETIANAFPNVLLGPGQNAKKTLEDPVGYYDQHESKVRELVESAMAAKIAFLNWHVQNQPKQCIALGHYGCVVDSECCDGTKCLANVCDIPIL
jgi:hypothetical protein